MRWASVRISTTRVPLHRPNVPRLWAVGLRLTRGPSTGDVRGGLTSSCRRRGPGGQPSLSAASSPAPGVSPLWHLWKGRHDLMSRQGKVEPETLRQGCWIQDLQSIEALLAFLPLGKVGKTGSRLWKNLLPPPTWSCYMSLREYQLLSLLIVWVTPILLPRQEKEWGPIAPSPRISQ